jgi:carboxyl-terminal processing protease
MRFVALLLVFAGLAAGPGHAQDLDFERDRARIILAKISSDIEKNFYDPQLRGLDWKALYAQTRARIDSARSVNDIYTAIFVLVDQLHDSHTKFLPPQRAVRIRFGFDAQAYGDKVLISTITKKGAAEGAGLLPGDRILLLNGFRVERAVFDEMMLMFRVLQPVTAMDLVVQRGNDPPRRLHLEARVQPESLVEDLTKLDNLYKLIREGQAGELRAKYLVDQDGVGYVWLPSFGYDPEDALRLMGKIEKARAVVLDLRDNPGGRVDTLVTLAGCFQEEPVVLAEEVMRKKTEPVRIKPQKPNFKGPLVILVDSQSSSASEAFARHFQRTGRGVVIGDRTSGRLTAARFFTGRVGVETIALYGVQVAVARVVFPGGEELEGKGVTPDQACIPTPDDLREGRDPCRGLAVRLAREKLGPSAEPPKQEKSSLK